MTTGLAAAGILISGAALAISTLSALFARREVRLAERSRARDFEATVVAELTRVHTYDRRIEYELQVTNAGPAIARDVDVALVKWDDAGEPGKRLDEAQVAPALLRGERRTVSLTLRDRSVANDRAMSIELCADYYDDNGVRNERLAQRLFHTSKNRRRSSAL